MINAKAAQGVGIANMTVTGDELWVTLTDHTLLGPYTLPVVSISFVGAWQPHTQYYTNQILTANGSTYIVTANHVSAASFDPGANDGHGNNYYGLLLSYPGSSLPTGGATGQLLEKSGTADFTVAWTWMTLAGLHDVLASPGPATGDLVYWNGTAFSYIKQTSVSGAPPNLSDLADVQQSPGPTTDQVIYWTGGHWSFSALSSLYPIPVQNLAQLGDVAPTPPPATGQVVYFNGSQFSYETLVSSLLTDFNLSGSPGNYDIIHFDTASSKWINRQPIRYASVAGASYALNLSDAMSLLDLTGGGQAINVFPDSSVNFPAGATVWLRQLTAGTGSINTIVAGSGVTISKPAGRLLKTRATGSIVMLQKISTNQWEASGDLAFDTSGNVLPSTGTWNADPTLNDCDVYLWTPTGNNTVNMVSGAVQAGKRMHFVITTSGTTSYTLTFGTGFKSQGTLATGVTSGKVFTIVFIGDGTNFNETSRTTAM